MGKSFMNHNTDDDNVGGHVTGYDQGDDGRESDVWANADQSKEGIKYSSEGDCEKRNWSFAVNLLYAC